MWFWNGIFRSVHGNNRCNRKAYVSLEIISLLQKDKSIIWTVQIALLLKSDKIFSKLCEQQTFLIEAILWLKAQSVYKTKAN